MERILYLATASVTRQPYMDDSTVNIVTRIVWATSPEEAKEKVEKALTVNDPYGIAYYVNWVDLEPAIE